jgi:hypothetical protein
MANLLDTVQQKLAGQAPKPQQQETGLGATSGIETLLRQGKGKAVGPQTGPRGSALGERIQARQAELEQQTVADQGKIAGQQQMAQEADIDQRAQQEQQQAQQQLQQMGQKTQMQIDNLLDSYAQGQRRLESDEDLANLELIGFNARLSNDQYINQLQNEGQTKRLDNMLNFKTELAKDVFAGQNNLLNDKLKMQAMMDMDDRQFAEQLGEMDINYAMDVIENQIKADASRQKWQAVGQVAQAGVQFAGSEAGKNLFSLSDTPEGKA